MNALAMLSQQSGEYEQAKEYYKQSLEIYNEIGDHGSEAEVLGGLGYTAQLQDALEEAKQYYQRSLDLVSGETEDRWYFLGASTLSERRIRIPEDVLDIGMFNSEDEVYWAFVETNGMRIISNGHIEQNQVSFLGSRKLDVSNRVSVPHPMVANGEREPPEQSKVPEYAKMSEEETYHFVVTEDLLESDPKICYLMTSHELGEMITKAPDRETIHAPMESPK